MPTPGVALFCFSLPLPHHAQKLFLLTFLEVTKEYNPQNEMFDNRKTKRCIFKTKRIFSVSPPFIKTM